MKTITRTFYVNDNCMDDLRSHRSFDYRYFSTSQSRDDENQIQISWQEPDTKYELTVDEIFNLCSDWIHDSAVPSKFKEYVKKKLEDR